MENNRKIEPVTRAELEDIAPSYSKELQPFIHEYLARPTDEVFNDLAEDDSQSHDPLLDYEDVIGAESFIDLDAETPLNLSNDLPRQVQNISNYSHEFLSRNNRMPSIEEISHQFGITIQKAQELTEVGLTQHESYLEDINKLLLNESTDANEEFEDVDDLILTIDNMLADPLYTDTPENITEKKDFNTRVIKLLKNSSLSEREKKIIILRYGLGRGDDGKPRSAISRMGLGIDGQNLSRERIAQIEANGLGKFGKSQYLGIIQGLVENIPDNDRPQSMPRLISDVIRIK